MNKFHTAEIYLSLSKAPGVSGIQGCGVAAGAIATVMVHWQQYCTNGDFLVHQLESQGLVIKTPSPFNSLVWPVQRSDGGWRLTVEHYVRNKVMPALRAAVPDMLELQYELESKAAK